MPWLMPLRSFYSELERFNGLCSFAPRAQLFSQSDHEICNMTTGVIAPMASVGAETDSEACSSTISGFQAGTSPCTRCSAKDR